MLQVIKQTLTENATAVDVQNAPANASVNASVNAPVNAPVKLPIDVTAAMAELKTPEAILHLLTHTPALTRQQLAEVIGKDIRTIGRAISKLQREGKLVRVGSAKSGYWQVQA